MSSKKKNKFKTPKSEPEGKIVVPIKGMHCRSCEILISEKLEELASIKNVAVSYRRSEALVCPNGPLDMKAVKTAVQEAGYEIGVDDSKAWITLDPAKYKDLAGAFVVLLILYFVAQKMGIKNINVGSSGGNPSSLAVVLVVGLTAGISTCMALVGGLVLGISARHAEKHPEATPAQSFRPHIFFNIGRIISYFVLGGVIGLAGKSFQLFGPSLGVLTIMVGLVMLTLGAQLTEMFPRLSSGGLTLPSSVGKLLGIRKHHEKEYSHTNSMMVGALTFFLPCGFTQAMQLYAMSTSKFWSGAAIMGIFALGTAPGLLSIGGLTSVIKGAFAKKFFKFAGLLVITLAIFNISNGWNLTGWKLPSLQIKSGPSGQADSETKTRDGIQIVNMTQSSSGYSPNSFIVKKGVPVRWIINSTDSQTCAASILFSEFGIRKALKPGENIIEFTPNESGNFKFSCSMGMYRGTFRVTENDNKTSQDTVPGQQPQPSVKPDSNNQNDSRVQVIKTTYASLYQDIVPNDFTVKVDQPIRFEIATEIDGQGCMSTIMVPGLANEPELLEKGKTIVFNFTPTKKGNYEITCAMGVPRGIIKVI